MEKNFFKRLWLKWSQPKNGSVAHMDLMEMVYVEGGTFQMGATPEQGDDAQDDEKPVHKVTLDSFYIGKYAVTQAQWQAVMGMTLAETQAKTPHASAPLYGIGDDYPMYYVSWEDAQAFCAKLSERTGKTWRLPTEAEWEYAARGGKKADGTKYAGSNRLDDVAWYVNNSDDKMHPVGKKNPNGLGLYDMSGNVAEMCSDRYAPEYYAKSPSDNPENPLRKLSLLSPELTVLGCVTRGGAWNSAPQDCRVSKRDHIPDGYCGSSNIGFRVVCER